MSPDDVWHEADYESVWEPFDRRFAFAPDYYERTVPAITVPADALVLDLAPVFENDGPRFAADEAAVNAAALRWFVRLVGNEELIALDWQHQSYRYSPDRQAITRGEPAVPVFPNGDYYAHMMPDLRWGTFGHPWQQTLTLWGHELVDGLGAELSAWLPRHPQSPL